jgi:hypothetical protein
MEMPDRSSLAVRTSSMADGKILVCFSIHPSRSTPSLGRSMVENQEEPPESKSLPWG